MSHQSWIRSLIRRIKKWFYKLFHKTKIVDDSPNCLNAEAEIILLTIVEELKKSNIQINAVSPDGRINSAVGEDDVLDKLKENENIAKFLEENDLELIFPASRFWYDFAIQKKNNWKKLFIPVNIKISAMKQADNVSSKEGLYFALTNKIYKTSKELNFCQNLVNNIDKMAQSDYYFLIVNKNQTSDIYYTSLKTLSNITPNGSNLPFQAHWGKNRVRRTKRTNEEAIKFVFCNYRKSYEKKTKKYNEGFDALNQIYD